MVSEGREVGVKLCSVRNAGMSASITWRPVGGVGPIFRRIGDGEALSPSAAPRWPHHRRWARQADQARQVCRRINCERLMRSWLAPPLREGE